MESCPGIALIGSSVSTGGIVWRACKNESAVCESTILITTADWSSAYVTDHTRILGAGRSFQPLYSNRMSQQHAEPHTDKGIKEKSALDPARSSGENVVENKGPGFRDTASHRVLSTDNETHANVGKLTHTTASIVGPLFHRVHEVVVEILVLPRSAGMPRSKGV
uniref:Uncharacterized protein n=1 Tax=Anopheles minimus TaxID=112268 RepID=A0A182WG01_9DIPT